MKGVYMFKRFVFLFLVILILFTPACGEKQVISSMTAQEMVEYIDKRIDEKNSTQTVEWASATVISVGAGNANVHFPADPVGTNVVVQNPREISLEVDDEVSILKFGSLSNAIVDFKKDIIMDNIYVDYLTGVDDYRHGAIDTPFKTLQYAINRLPKNLNGRVIWIYFDTLTNEDLIIRNFYGGQIITIQSLDGNTTQTLNTILVADCMVDIDIHNLKINGNNPRFDSAVFVLRCLFVYFENCDTSSSEFSISDGFCAAYGSNMFVVSCVISNRKYAIRGDSITQIFSSTNTGSNNTYAIFGQRNSIIGTYGSQPSGEQWVDDSSTIQ
jgi:Na+-transporting methylmalonyl-CoA/oxaloacetate decarboxylase gamma subunit